MFKIKEKSLQYLFFIGGNLVLMKTELVAMFMSHKQINNAQ